MWLIETLYWEQGREKALTPDNIFCMMANNTMNHLSSPGDSNDRLYNSKVRSIVLVKNEVYFTNIIQDKWDHSSEQFHLLFNSASAESPKLRFLTIRPQTTIIWQIVHIRITRGCNWCGRTNVSQGEVANKGIAHWSLTIATQIRNLRKYSSPVRWSFRHVVMSR